MTPPPFLSRCPARFPHPPGTVRCQRRRGHRGQHRHRTHRLLWPFSLAHRMSSYEWSQY